MQQKQKPSVPPMTSTKKEAEFWDNHSALDYDLNFSSEQLDVHPDVRSIAINLRLPRGLVNKIKVLAQEDGVSYQRFMRQVLMDFVESRQQREHKPE